MAIPVTIEKLLQENIVEWARIEFKEGWNPETTLKTISAFANDMDNWGGGYIVIGAKEENGKLVRPVKGIDASEIDSIQKEVLRYCKFLRPVYIPQSQPVTFEGKTLLLVWCPGGYERPYACPKNPLIKNSKKIYYVRKLSSTIEATSMDVKELMALANNIPFDDRMNPRAEIKDLKFPIMRNYLQNVGSDLLSDIDNLSVEMIAENLRIVDGPKEYLKPLNVGLLFFNDAPERFFPYSQIEVVNIPDPTGQGMEERIFRGPIDEQLRSALSYIRNYVIAEKIFKIAGQAEAQRIANYSYEALEEFISNAIYHRSYQMGYLAGTYAYEELGLKTCAVIEDVTDSYSTSVGDYMVETFTSLGGECLDKEEAQNGDNDFRAQLTKIAALSPDVLFVPWNYENVALIAQQARELGITAVLFGADGWEMWD